MTALQTFITENRKLCEAATPGPWGVTDVMGKTWLNIYDAPDNCVCVSPGQESPISNAELIVAARTALPLALDALEVAVKFLGDELCMCELEFEHVCIRCVAFANIEKILIKE